MPTLVDAYNELSSGLRPQKQGTCGLYSFWFASILINQVSGGGRPIAYPRSSEYLIDIEGLGSTRRYAKTLGAGQGEVLTAAEMTDIVLHFGFRAARHDAGDGHDAFISTSLAANRPVMFPYMMSGAGPISSLPVGARPGVDYGPHWSLIFAEEGGEYVYIEPNAPCTLVRRLKKTVLDSNAFVDSYKYVRFWEKGAGGGISPIGDALGGFTKRFYDIGPGTRENLKNVLIAVH